MNGPGVRARRALMFDVAVAVVAAVLIVVLSPGIALAGVIALVALILVLLSRVFGWLWRRVRPRPRPRPVGSSPRRTQPNRRRAPRRPPGPPRR